MKIFIKTFLFISAISFFNVNLFAEKFIVSNVSEINSAMANVQAGDSIIMANGVWINSKIIFHANGNSGSPIYLLAETPGKVVLTGSSTLRIAGNYLTVEGLFFKDGYSGSGAVVEFRNSNIQSNYSRLTNCAIINYNPDDKDTDYKWISLYGTHNRVDHCFIKGKTHSGTTLVVWLDGNPNYHLIDHNYFGSRPDLGYNGGETIRVGTSDWSMYDSYTTVEYNYFEECDGEIEIISNKSCENTYRYNTFYKCAGTLTLRHGNRCQVYGNYFFGAFKANTGGVRIIGEDHKVYNNYFTQLSGSGYSSALTMVNGVENSPANRYFQVKNAIVAFNTFVDNKHTITIGAGKSSEQSLPPKNCIVANNIVKTSYSPIIIYTDQPDSLTWQSNLMFGANLGITKPDGIKIEDPKLHFVEDDLWKLQNDSPAIDSSKGNFDFISDDFDGQLRDNLPDIGSDEYSNQPIIRHPVGADSVGITWMGLINFNPRLKKVQAGTDSLLNAITSANAGDIIELVSDGGNYSNTADINISIPITIRASKNSFNRPVVTNTNQSQSSKSIFVINDGGELNLQGIELDGMSNSLKPAKYLIRTSDQPMQHLYKLIVDNCFFKNIISGAEGNFFRAYPGTIADSIKFNNSLFTNCGKEGIRLKDESGGGGKFNANYFEAANCTFWNIPQEAIYIYGGDNNPVTAGPLVIINHCTFYNCGNSNSSIINLSDVDDAQIKNSILAGSPGNNYSIWLDGSTASISYSDTINIGAFQLRRNAFVGTRLLGNEPLFTDAENDNFLLQTNSSLLGQASDWRAMGDLRWDPTITSFREQINKINPSEFLLQQNYPNPFNPTTKIRYTIPSVGMAMPSVQLKIYDVLGNGVATLLNREQSAGNYEINFNAAGLPSGVYYYTLTVNNFIQTKKMILIK